LLWSSGITCMSLVFRTGSYRRAWHTNDAIEKK
jgi:hypothetical protein